MSSDEIGRGRGPGSTAGRRDGPRSQPNPSHHFQIGKDYAHAAHRHGDGEAMLKGRIIGTLAHPSAKLPMHAPEPAGPPITPVFKRDGGA
jgi:hypothetical protein